MSAYGREPSGAQGRWRRTTIIKGHLCVTSTLIHACLATPNAGSALSDILSSVSLWKMQWYVKNSCLGPYIFFQFQNGEFAGKQTGNKLLEKEQKGRAMRFTKMNSVK